MSRPAIVMIGGGIQEVRAVEVAQSLGFTVVVTDRNPDAVCFDAADEWAVIDGRDVESLVAFVLLEKDRLNIRGVLTLTELVTSVAAVADAADLPGVSLKAAVACQNKALSKRIWEGAGVPTAMGGSAESEKDAVAIFERLGGQAFLKPSIGFGGQGARSVNSYQQLTTHMETLQGIGNGRAVLIEELLVGTMHDVNGLFDATGRFHGLGITDRRFLDGRPVECEIKSPTELSEEHQQELYALLEKGGRALGIELGPIKGDTVLTDHGFRLLEVAPRLHGPRNSLYILPMSGFEPLVPTLAVLTGQAFPSHTVRVRHDRYCVGRALLPRPGRVERTTRLGEAEGIDGIEHIMVFVREGDVIPPYRDSTHVPAYVFAAGESFEACEEALQQVAALVAIDTMPVV